MDDTQKRIAQSFRALTAIEMQKQADLAAVLGLTQRSVSQKLRGESPWTARDLELLSVHFNVSVERIMAGPWAWLRAAGETGSRQGSSGYPALGSGQVNDGYPALGSPDLADALVAA